MLAIAFASLLTGCGAVAVDNDDATATPEPLRVAQTLEGEGTVDPVALYVATNQWEVCATIEWSASGAGYLGVDVKSSARASYVSRLAFTGADDTTRCATILDEAGRFWVDVYSCATWRVEVRAVALTARRD